MTTFSHETHASRPFGAGLKDEDLKLMVASTDMRYRQKLRAIVVRRSSAARTPLASMSAELIVLNTRDNLAELQDEAHNLDPNGRLLDLGVGDIADVVLESGATGERVMITSVNTDDFKRLEQIAHVVQIHIGGREDRGSWVCRVIDSDRIDAYFSGRIIDVSGPPNN
jgi:hypothetical protein